MDFLKYRQAKTSLILFIILMLIIICFPWAYSNSSRTAVKESSQEEVVNEQSEEMDEPEEVYSEDEDFEEDTEEYAEDQKRDSSSRYAARVDEQSPEPEHERETESEIKSEQSTRPDSEQKFNLEVLDDIE